jgi:hypothetical protein
LIEAAHGHARYDTGPLLRSWLHCVAAEVTAKTGSPQESLKHVRQAEDSLATSGIDAEWLDYYDASRLPGFAGYCQLVAGKPAEAATTLQTALASLDSRATKQRAVILLDLALAHAAQDAEQAAALAGQALDVLEKDWYGTAFERVPQVRAALEPTPFARQLEERSRTLPSSGSRLLPRCGHARALAAR